MYYQGKFKDLIKILNILCQVDKNIKIKNLITMQEN